MIFLSGGVCFLNLSTMKYGVPQHYNASIWQVVMAVFLGICFAIRSQIKAT
jgi:hypothetical protein